MEVRLDEISLKESFNKMIFSFSNDKNYLVLRVNEALIQNQLYYISKSRKFSLSNTKKLSFLSNSQRFG